MSIVIGKEPKQCNLAIADQPIEQVQLSWREDILELIVRLNTRGSKTGR